MDPVERAAVLVLTFFAGLFTWDAFGRGAPATSSAATTSAATTSAAPATVTRPPAGTPEPDAGDAAAAYVQEACQIHARWSGANRIHVACFDLFEILQADGASFSEDVDALAAVVGPAMDNIRRDDDKIQLMLLSYEYLCDDARRAVYTSQLMPLIAEQRQASGLACSSHVPFHAYPYGPAYASVPGAMDRACGW